MKKNEIAKAAFYITRYTVCAAVIVCEILHARADMEGFMNSLHVLILVLVVCFIGFETMIFADWADLQYRNAREKKAEKQQPDKPEFIKTETGGHTVISTPARYGAGYPEWHTRVNRERDAIERFVKACNALANERHINKPCLQTALARLRRGYFEDIHEFRDTAATAFLILTGDPNRILSGFVEIENAPPLKKNCEIERALLALLDDKFTGVSVVQSDDKPEPKYDTNSRTRRR